MFITELDNYFNAGVPAIQVSTLEEKRLVKEVVNFYGEDEVVCWSLTQNYYKAGDLKNDNDPGDIIEALSQIYKKSEEIFIFFDLDEIADVVIKRKLREIIPICESTEKKLILINKKLIEMNEITSLSFELPNRDDIKEILTDTVESVESANGSVKLNDATKSDLINAALGLTQREIVDAFSLAVIENEGLDKKAIKIVQRLKAEHLSRGGVLEYYEPDITVKDVGGNKALIDYIEKRKKLYTNEAREANIPFPKGIIITGVTGTGKSLTAKMISAYFNQPLLRFNIGAVFGSLVGQSEERFRNAVKQVDAIGRCVLWLDEIEKAFSGIKSGITGSDVSPRLFGEFLTWLTERKGEAYIVATCNNILALPPEITNRSRFDEVFFIDLPNEVERREVFEIHLSKKKKKISSLDKAVTASDGYTSSEIEQIVSDAIINAFYDSDEINEKYLLGSISSIKPISQIMKDDIDNLRSYAKDRFRMAAYPTSDEEFRKKGSRKISIKGSKPNDFRFS